jgi:hypothetical protein
MTHCAQCGTANPVNAAYCEKCGQPLETAAVPAVFSPAAAPSPPAASRTNPLAIASLLTGFFSLAPPFAIMAITFGHLALSQIRKSAGRQKGRGLAIAGLVMGYLCVAFILFLLLVVLPSLH